MTTEAKVVELERRLKELEDLNIASRLFHLEYNAADCPEKVGGGSMPSSDSAPRETRG